MDEVGSAELSACTCEQQLRAFHPLVSQLTRAEPSMHYDWSVWLPSVCTQDDIYGDDIYGGVSEPTKTDVSAHANNATLVQAHQVRSDEAVL